MENNMMAAAQMQQQYKMYGIDGNGSGNAALTGRC